MKKETTSIKFGIFTGLFLIVFFSLLGALGLIHSPAYSIINAFICAIGIFLAISNRSNSKDFTYQVGFKTGIQTGLYATIIFTAFFAIFAAKTDGLIANLTKNIGFDLNYILLLISVFVLGIISIYVVTYLLMNIFKKNWNLK